MQFEGAVLQEAHPDAMRHTCEVLFMQMCRAGIEEPDLPAVDPLFEVPLDGFAPVLGPTLRYQADLLGVATPPLPAETREQQAPYYSPRASVIRKAELFTDGRHVLAVVLPERQEQDRVFIGAQPPPSENTAPFTLFAYLIGPDRNSEPLDAFMTSAASVLNVTPARFHYTDQRFEELKTEGGRTSPTAPTDWELNAANVLTDKPTRILALAIKASGGLLVNDLPRQLPAAERGHVDDLLSRLMKARTRDERGLCHLLEEPEPDGPASI
jgi:hypothetical protein